MRGEGVICFVKIFLEEMQIRNNYKMRKNKNKNI